MDRSFISPIALRIDSSDIEIQKDLSFKGHLTGSHYDATMDMLENVLSEWFVHTFSPNDFANNNCTIIYDFENKKITYQEWNTVLDSEQSNLPEWRRTKVRKTIGEIKTFDMDLNYSIEIDIKKHTEPWQKTICGMNQNDWIPMQ